MIESDNELDIHEDYPNSEEEEISDNKDGIHNMKVQSLDLQVSVNKLSILKLFFFFTVKKSATMGEGVLYKMHIHEGYMKYKLFLNFLKEPWK